MYLRDEKTRKEAACHMTAHPKSETSESQAKENASHITRDANE